MSKLKLMAREDGSFSVYYPQGGAHMVVYDSLDGNRELTAARREIEALRSALTEISFVSRTVLEDCETVGIEPFHAQSLRTAIDDIAELLKKGGLS